MDIEMVEAGLARHEVDWIWGINISRALMDFARRASGRRVILSAGRVQSPTLVYAYKTWLQRALHLPEPVFQITVRLEKDNVEFTARPLARASSRAEAEKISMETRKAGYLIVEDSRSRVNHVRPPPAFNLPTLQAEASRVYGFSPSYTQRLAEELYLAAAISYPRTNSEKLPPTIGYRSILEELAANTPGYSTLAMRLLEKERLQPRQGPREDPAHPAIYPTGNPPPRDAGRNVLRVYDLIVRRFLAAFHGRAAVEHTSVKLRHPVLDIAYTAKGVRIVEMGWLDAYPYSRPEEEALPPLRPGDKPRVVSGSYRLRWSEPGIPGISRIRLVKWMEKVGIGTEATRARIVETLYKRGYLEHGRSGDRVTPMGMTVSAMLEEMFPQLSTPDLTRELERELELVRLKKKSRDTVVEETKNIVSKLIAEFQSKLEGERLEKLAERAGLIRPRVQCSLCELPAEAEAPIPLCPHHRKALEKLVSAIPRLSSRTGLDLDRLLAKLVQGSGEFVAGVARVLLQRPELRDKLLRNPLSSKSAEYA